MSFSYTDPCNSTLCADAVSNISEYNTSIRWSMTTQVSTWYTNRNCLRMPEAFRVVRLRSRSQFLVVFRFKRLYLEWGYSYPETGLILNWGPGDRFTNIGAHFESKLTVCVFLHLEFTSSLLKSAEPFQKEAHFWQVKVRQHGSRQRQDDNQSYH